jgi:hypothetical protein
VRRDATRGAAHAFELYPPNPRFSTSSLRSYASVESVILFPQHSHSLMARHAHARETHWCRFTDVLWRCVNESPCVAISARLHLFMARSMLGTYEEDDAVLERRGHGAIRLRCGRSRWDER